MITQGGSAQVSSTPGTHTWNYVTSEHYKRGLDLIKIKAELTAAPVLRRGCLERLIYWPMPPFARRGSVGRLAHKALILITRSRSIHLLALIENSPILRVHCLPHAASLMAEICFAAPAIQAAF